MHDTSQCLEAYTGRCCQQSKVAHAQPCPVLPWPALTWLNLLCIHMPTIVLHLFPPCPILPTTPTTGAGRRRPCRRRRHRGRAGPGWHAAAVHRLARHSGQGSAQGQCVLLGVCHTSCAAGCVHGLWWGRMGCGGGEHSRPRRRPRQIPRPPVAPHLHTCTPSANPQCACTVGRWEEGNKGVGRRAERGRCLFAPVWGFAVAFYRGGLGAWWWCAGAGCNYRGLVVSW